MSTPTHGKLFADEPAPKVDRWVCPTCKQRGQVVRASVIYQRQMPNGDFKLVYCATCSAHVRIGSDGEPIGLMANADARSMRKKLHSELEHITKSIGIDVGREINDGEQIRIAMLDATMCRELITKARKAKAKHTRDAQRQAEAIAEARKREHILSRMAALEALTTEVDDG